MPDINILKDICREYSVSLDEVLGDTKGNNAFKLVIAVVVVLIIGIIGVVMYLNNQKQDNFEFKTLISTCSNFIVSGSIAYNDIKSSIYISHVDYCGGDDDTLYQELSCVFYEVDGDLKKEISEYNYNGNTAITLEEFLSDVKFNIDNYAKVCKKYQEYSFLLEVDATNEDGETVTHKIPLKLEDNC